MNDLDLTGRIALVTGASAGIGHAIAHALHAQGASVVVTSRSDDRAEIAAQGLDTGDTGRVLGIGCDVRDPEACEAAIAKTLDAFGGLHILVNNAGLGVFKSIREMSIEEWERQIRTNLDGVFYTTKAALPALVEADDAWIVNIGSLASRNTFAGGVGYNASKFGLLGMTEAMMLDLRYDGIRAAIVMPGSVNTDFSHVGQDRQWAIQPQDVADSVLHLMSQPQRTLISRVEVRPSAPPQR
jgi:NADP-dependent 3-hydroxy acid dehydrogenase YdfG